MNNRNLISQILVFILVGFGNLACTNFSSNSGELASKSSVSFSGMASLGPISNATISIYKLNSDGSRGSLLTSTTSNANGTYTTSIPAASGPVIVVVTNGSYKEEATGATVSLGANEVTAVVPNGTSNRQVAVTALTHLAAQRLASIAATSTDLNAAVTATNLAVAQAAGLSSGADITTVIPADPTLSLSAQSISTTSDRAKYALLLASISELAHQNGITSINVMKTFADDFKADGALDGVANGAVVVFKDNGGATVATATANSWGTDLSAAASTYLASNKNSAGFSSDSKTTLQAAPITGSVSLTGVANLTAVPAQLKALVVQPDDKIVVAGFSIVANSNRQTVMLMRYLPTGALDSTFGNGGSVALSLGAGNTSSGFGPSSEINALALQSDGKILAGGFTSSNTNGQHALLIRFNTNGSLDTTFGTGGIERPKLNATFDHDMINALAIQSDGKIVAVGSTTISSVDAFSVWRFNSDGQLDTTFNTTGNYRMNPIGNNCMATAVVVQPDGAILVGGNTIYGTGTQYIGALRLLTDGTLDTVNFGGGGAGGGSIPDLIPLAFLYQMKLQTDGSVFLVGASTSHGMVAKILPSGALDTTFATSGFFTLNLNMGTWISSLTPFTVSGVQKYLISGSPSYDLGVERINADFTPDTTFGSDPSLPGIVIGNVTGDDITTYFDDYSVGLGRLSNGDFVLVGYTDDVSGNDSPVIEFHNADGSVKSTIGVNGAVHATASITITGAGEDKANASVVQSDGKIVVVGTTGTNGSPSNSSTNDFFVLRYNSDGSLDTTFGPNSDGKAVFDLQGNVSIDDATSVAVDANGKIIVAGTTIVSTRQALAVIRLNTNGSLDTTFGGGLVQMSKSNLDISSVAVAVQQNGKIAIGANLSDLQSSGQPSIIVFRINANGTFDTTFGPSNDGSSTLTVGQSYASTNAIAIDSNNQILLAASATVAGDYRYVVVRLTSTGDIDTAWGSSGLGSVVVNGTPFAMKIDSSGRIVLAGNYTDTGGNNNYFVLTRFTSAGALDTTFGTSGIATTLTDAIGGGYSYATVSNMTIDSQSRIIVGGKTFDTDGHQHVTLARYSANGVLDTSIGAAGIKSFQIADSEEVSLSGLSVDSSGQITFSGTVNTASLLNQQVGTGGNEVYMAKFTP